MENVFFFYVGPILLTDCSFDIKSFNSENKAARWIVLSEDQIVPLGFVLWVCHIWGGGENTQREKEKVGTPLTKGKNDKK